VTGRLGLEGSRDHWLLGVRGHVESARTIDPAGAISVRHSQAELSLGAALPENRVLQGAVLLGAGVDLISARASQYERAQNLRSFAPIGTLALRCGFRPHPLLDVFAAAELVLNMRRERFDSDGETLARTARARSRFLIGASWHVF